MAHVHTVEGQYGSSGPASVMADIGGDIGAAVLYTPETLLGSEIEIRAAGHEWDGAHTAVRERHVNSSVLWAGFFGALHAGRYELRVRGDASRSIELDVVGGVVTESRW